MFLRIKIGDRVRVSNPDIGDEHFLNKIGTVVENNGYGMLYTIKLDDDDDVYHFFEEELELIKDGRKSYHV